MNTLNDSSDGGLNELFDLNRKEVKKADDLLYKEAVFKSLHSPPRLLGFNRTTWRMQDLQSVLAAQGLKISVCNIGVVRPNPRKFRQAVCHNISGSNRIESII